MFGYHRAKRERKKLKKEKENISKEKEVYKKEKPALIQKQQQKQYQQDTRSIDDMANKDKERRMQARQEGREYGLDFLNQKVPGLDPEKRKALQYEAHRGIDRSSQEAERRLLGDQSRRGIVGKGGVGYAQQRDLQRLANDSRGQVDRDLTKLDSDLSLKNMAALFNVEQGEAAQSQLDRQSAANELQLSDEKRRQREFEDKINDLLFNRL